MAVTVITTNGKPSIVCEKINPVKVATRFSFAKKKNTLDAVIISGTIRGEIMIAIIALRNGMYGRLRPSAAIIPSVVARKVAIIPMKRLFCAPKIHLSLQTVVIPGSEQSPIRSLYQRKEKASGSKAIIPGVNSRNGEDEKEIGITAIRGITRKKSTITQIAM